jgi:hypothetical protein
VTALRSSFSVSNIIKQSIAAYNQPAHIDSDMLL